MIRKIMITFCPPSLELLEDSSLLASKPAQFPMDGKKNHDIFLSSIFRDIGGFELVGFQTSSIPMEQNLKLSRGEGVRYQILLVTVALLVDCSI